MQVRRCIVYLVLILAKPTLGDGKGDEDTIPVIEIQAEGRPMSSAQIRALEEEIEGKPLDVKIVHLATPRNCSRKSAAHDFVTFQYRGFLENGRLFDSTYLTNASPARVQLNVGQIIAGLDKALTGLCQGDFLKVSVPWRLARRRSAKRWSKFPKEEHWIVFEIYVDNVEPWSVNSQFKELDRNNDGLITKDDILNTIEYEKEEYGKALLGYNIDNDQMAAYWIGHFDTNRDGRVTLEEYAGGLEADSRAMRRSSKAKVKGRARDPGVAWILDFNNDGVVDYDELTSAKDVFAAGNGVPSNIAQSEL